MNKSNWRYPSPSEFMAMDGISKVIGPFGEGLYWKMRRGLARPNGEFKNVTIDEIARSLSVTRVTLHKYLKLFFSYGLVAKKTFSKDKRRIVLVFTRIRPL